MPYLVPRSFASVDALRACLPGSPCGLSVSGDGLQLQYFALTDESLRYLQCLAHPLSLPHVSTVASAASSLKGRDAKYLQTCLSCCMHFCPFH